VSVASRVCVVSLKECWQDEAKNWYSSGGFPVQMKAIASLFDSMTLLITRRAAPGQGGLRLPEGAEVVVLPQPGGEGFGRKLAVVRQLGYYCRTIANVMLATGEDVRPPAPGVHWIFATGVRREELAGIEPATDRGLSGPPRLAYIGRLSPEKGVSNLIRAVARLREIGRAPQPHVHVIGDGPERAALEDLTRALGCGDRVTFEGQLNRDRLNALLSQADFTVQPSLTEGYCKAWLDAFAHGLPVLSSEAGAARVVIGAEGERGWLVPPGDLTALTAALGRTITEPRDWEPLRRRCRAFAEERTLEVWAETIGRICARQWAVPLEGGKLRFAAGAGVEVEQERECRPA
jgi:glycosyltransferase involved in cell wall biosynthesis